MLVSNFKKLISTDTGKLSLLFGLYFITAKIGLSVYSKNQFITLLWAPTGIALGFLLLYGLRFWPAIFAGAFFANWTHGGSLGVTLGITIGNTLEALIGAWLCLRVSDFDRGLSRIRDVTKVLVCGALVSTAISATIGVSTLYWGGLLMKSQLNTGWIHWWIGDAMGNLTVAPLILVIGTRLLSRRGMSSEARSTFPERMGFSALLIFASLIVLTGLLGSETSSFTREYFLFPLLLWASMRYRQVGSVLVIFTVAAIAVWNAVRGQGPFVSSVGELNLAHLMIFVSVLSLTGLVMGAVATGLQKEREILSHNKARTDGIFLAAIDCIISMDQDGKIREFNPASEETFGYTLEEVVGKDFSQLLIPPRLRALYSQEFSDYVIDGTGGLGQRRVEFFALHKEGVEFPIEMTIAIVRLQNSAPMYTAYVRDITERLRWEGELHKSRFELEKIVQERTLALRKSEERFRFLLEAVDDAAIYMLDPDGTVSTWNAGAERIKGYKADEILGQHYSVFYPPELIALKVPEKELQEASLRGRLVTDGWRRRKDGTRFWASIFMTALKDKNGEVTGFSKVTRDITERREAELKLQRLNQDLERRVEGRTKDLLRSEAQLRLIANAMPMLVARIDGAERILFSNEACSHWFECPPENAEGLTFRQFIGEETYLAVTPYMQRVLEGELVTFERESSHREERATFMMTFLPEFNEMRQTVGFIMVATDITKHKQIETELKKAKEAADSANVTKSAFLANMSHEIRTPLGIVLGFSELISSQELSPFERQRGVEAIKRNGQLLSNIINDILDLSKVEAGKLDVESLSVPFSEILSDITASHNLIAEEKGIRLDLRVEGLIPEFIKTDPFRLKQVLLNVIGNALKFTDKGIVEVVVGIKTLESGRNLLVFDVKDTGAGIEEEQAKRLFAPFSQADVSTTRKFGGTGLGLILSKKLAQALGGDVELLESRVGVGSTFRISIDIGLSNFTNPFVSSVRVFDGQSNKL